MDYERNKLINILNNNGVTVWENSLEDTLDIDSLAFVSIIVDIEELFSIAVDEEYLYHERLNNFYDFEQMIISILQNKLA